MRWVFPTLAALERIDMSGDHNQYQKPASQCDRCGEVEPAEIHTCSPQEPVLQDIEQYRLQMAAISTAAIGYWKEGDGILPDYDTPALRDVAKLYSKYEALYATPPQREWQGLTDEDWIIGKRSADYIAGAEWAEAKLKEKNYGSL